MISNNIKLVTEVRQELTEIVKNLIKVFSTDEIIEEVMELRGYHMSVYADKFRAMLKEVGVFKLDYFSEIELVAPKLTLERARVLGLVTEKGDYLLKGRYVVPIRDIANNVTALVGWYPDIKKYITTPTYGFSKDGQFFNIECYEKTMQGDFPKYKDSNGVELKNCEGLVYLVEGIFDTLALRALGFPALGNMGLDLSMMKTYILSRFGKVIAIPDNDKAGMSANKYLNQISGKGKKNQWVIENEHVIVSLFQGVKDVDDLIKGYDCFNDLLSCQIAKYKLAMKEE